MIVSAITCFLVIYHQAQLRDTVQLSSILPSLVILLSCYITSSPAQQSSLVQVKRVIDPEAEALRLAEMRRLQRQMKGVKLQYIAEDDTVFFDDVAGIGEAKVMRCATGCCVLTAVLPLHAVMAMLSLCCI